jgi:hypothetical protein
MRIHKLTIAALAVTSIVGSTFANSDTFNSLIQSLTSNIEFWYTSESIAVKEITTSKIVLESPIIKDEVGDPIKKYVVMYGPVQLADLQGSNLDALDQYKQKDFNFTTLPANNKVTFELNLTDNVDANKIYYVTVAPYNADNIMGEISPTEICFKLATQIDGEGNECINWSAQVLNAPGDFDLKLANITHTRAGNTITLKWTKIDAASKVQIFLANNQTQQFTLLGTPNMSAETFSFPLTSNAPQRVRFMALDSGGKQIGGEIIYTMNETISSGTPTTPTTPRPWVPTVPKVWPTENIAMVVILTLIGYGVARHMRKKKK